jgi:putative DNA primase/helicase
MSEPPDLEETPYRPEVSPRLYRPSAFGGEANGGDEEIGAGQNRSHSEDESDSPNTALKGQWIEEIEYAYEPELVEGLIPNAGVGVLFGPSSAGKSFIAIDWGIRMASGASVLDRHTLKAGVLYFAAEGHGGLRKRIYAARGVIGGEGNATPFNYLPAFLDLSTAGTGDVARLTDYASDISAEMKQRGAPLQVIIVDTLAAAAPSADENASRDMGPIMQSFHCMAAQLDCVVMLIAHTGKDLTRGLRGWSGIRANVDFAIECRVEKETDGEITSRRLWFEKCKDGPDGFVLAEYQLKTIVLGEKPSGEPDTTCCVEYSDAPKAPSDSEVRAEMEARKN